MSSCRRWMPWPRAWAEPGQKLSFTALESYLEDFEDISVAMERLNDPSDEILDWDEVKKILHDSD